MIGNVYKVRSWTMLGAALLAVWGVATPVGAQSVDTAEILATIDRQSNFVVTDFSAVLRITAQDPQRGVERTSVRMYRRDQENKFLLLIEEPIVQRGQGYLQDEESLWFYDPESRRFSHMSLRENFAGTDARNSDFAQSALAVNYRVLSYQVDVLGQIPVYILELEATNNTVSFPYLKLWVSQEGSLVLKQEDYSLNRRLLRTVLYPPPHSRIGTSVVAPTMIFIDELVPGRQTTIELRDLSVAPLPNNVFTKIFVEQISR